jgi:hypothetical protein
MGMAGSFEENDTYHVPHPRTSGHGRAWWVRFPTAWYWIIYVGILHVSTLII